MISVPPESGRSTLLLPAHPTPTVSSAHARRSQFLPFLDVYALPSGLLSYLSVEHGDELAMNCSLRPTSITYFSPSAAPMHRSAWKGNSRKFAITEFSEVALVLACRHTSPAS